MECPVCGLGGFTSNTTLERHVNLCLDEKSSLGHRNYLDAAETAASAERAPVPHSSHQLSPQIEAVDKHGTHKVLSRDVSYVDVVQRYTLRLSELQAVKDILCSELSNELPVIKHEKLLSDFLTNGAWNSSTPPAVATPFNQVARITVSESIALPSDISVRIDNNWSRALLANATSSVEELEMLIEGHFRAIFSPDSSHPLSQPYQNWILSWYEPYHRIQEPTTTILEQIASSIQEQCRILLRLCTAHYSAIFTSSSLSADTRATLFSAAENAISTLVWSDVYLTFFELVKRHFWAEDSVHAAKIRELKDLPFSLTQLSISPQLAGLDAANILGRCIATLRGIADARTPYTKLRIVAEALKQIVRSVEAASVGTGQHLPADDLLPLFCYVVVYAEVYDIYSQTSFIEILLNSDRDCLSGELGYAFATLQAALGVICLFEPKAIQQKNSSSHDTNKQTPFMANHNGPENALAPSGMPVQTKPRFAKPAELDDETDEYYDGSNHFVLKTFS